MANNKIDVKPKKGAFDAPFFMGFFMSFFWFFTLILKSVFMCVLSVLSVK